MKYTIIITVFNKEKYIEKALYSACNQSFKDYKIIVVNDGSTDNSDSIIKKYQKKYKFKYYKKDNSGISDTRNFAIEKVETKYFLFLDGDDYISLDTLEMVDKYDNYDVLSFNAVQLDSNYNFIKDINKPIFDGNGEEYFEKLVKERSEFAVPWGYIYNKNYFKEYKFNNPSGKIMEDYYITPSIIIKSKRIISIDFVGYYYVFNSDSIMNNSTEKLLNETYLDHFDKMMNLIDEYNETTQKNFKLYLAETMLWYGSKLKGKSQNNFIKIIKSKNIIQYLDKSLFRKKIINILLDLRIYYKCRKIIDFLKKCLGCLL